MLKMKITSTKEGTIVGICDSELIGKVLKDKIGCLDLQKHAGFYDGEIFDERSSAKARQIEIALKYCKSINAVGTKAIDFLKVMGYKTEGAKKIGGIPHVQIYKMSEPMGE